MAHQLSDCQQLNRRRADGVNSSMVNKGTSPPAITFLVGTMGLVASSRRLWAFSNTNSFTNATQNAVELIVWTVVEPEPGIYLLSAFMLMLRRLFGRSNIYSLKIGRKDRSKANRHSEVLHAPYDSEGGGIALGNRPAMGFKDVAYNEDSQDATRSASAQYLGGRLATSNIKITTNIKQHWNDV